MATENQTEDQGSGPRIGLIVGAIAIAALLVFIFQNTDDTVVKFLWMEGEVPRFLLILITVVLTLVISIITTWLLNRRSRR